MLAAIGTGRIDSFESPTEALDAMAKNPPDLVIAAAMQPIGGAALVACMRQANAGPMTLVPAMIMSARAKPALVEEALKAGAHQVLVLPTTASTLYRRLDWLINGYVLSGMEERLSLSFQRPACVPAGVAPVSRNPGFTAPVPTGRRAKKSTRVLPH
jgi:two-component system, chemotaxis family, chemotaxis protein CheY